MKKKSENRIVFLMTGFSVLLTTCMLFYTTSCSGNKAAKEETKTDDEAFYATQPLQSGLYDADYYDIVGKNPRKGKFDGRIYFSLSPETSGINVFENGNRTKIDYLVVLPKPFEKNDSGIYVADDSKGKSVCIVPDSVYTLKFIHFNDTVCIGFNPKPRHTGSAIQILEKINERRNK